MKYKILPVLIGLAIFSGCDGALGPDLSGGGEISQNVRVRGISTDMGHSAYGDASYSLPAEIDESTKTITIYLSDAMDLSALNMAIDIPEGAEIVSPEGAAYPSMDEDTPVLMSPLNMGFQMPEGGDDSGTGGGSFGGGSGDSGTGGDPFVGTGPATAGPMGTSFETTFKVRNEGTTVTYKLIFVLLAQDYTPIFAEENFEHVRNNVDSNYILMNDIALTADFEPIGSTSAPFSGIFDGNGKTISNLKITKSGENNVGFFRLLGGSATTTAEVSNLTLVLADGNENNPSIQGGSYTGAVAGQGYGSVVGVGVVGGAVKGVNDVGGLVGRLFPNTNNTNLVIGTYVTADVIGTGNYVGGLVGNFDKGVVSTSFATGTVKGVAGAAGLVGGSSVELTIGSSYMTGDVRGSAHAAGGLVGSVAKCIMGTSYFAGTVHGTRQVGGLIGQQNNADLTIRDSYVLGEVKGTHESHGYSIGGLIGEIVSEGTRSIQTSYVAGLVSSEDTRSTASAALVGNGASRSLTLTNVYFDVILTGQTVVSHPSITGATEYYTVDAVVRVTNDADAEAIKQSDFSNWDSSIWQWQDGQWPKFHWQNP